MIGKIFSVLAISSTVTAVIMGNCAELCKGIIEGASKSVSVTLSLMGMMALWNGIMNVLKESGAIGALSRLMRPLLKWIFPSSFKNETATEEITACISANLLGISNAATPLGIKAIEKMNDGTKYGKATDDMISLCLLGCSCFNLMPTTLLALRSSFNAAVTYEIILPIWICSGLCMVFTIFISRLFRRMYEHT